MKKLNPEEFKDARRGRSSEINLALDKLPLDEVILIEPEDKTFSSDVSTYVSNAFRHTEKKFRTAVKKEGGVLVGWMVKRVK